MPIISLIKFLLITTLGMTMLVSTSFAEQQSRLIINAQTAVDFNEISIKRIFLMKQKTWPDGSRIKVFVLDDKHPVHQVFIKNYLKMQPHQIERHWKRLMFSGTGKAPTRVDNEERMLELVANTPGALGYISGQMSIRDTAVKEFK